jgi:hypothetical protein
MKIIGKHEYDLDGIIDRVQVLGNQVLEALHKAELEAAKENTPCNG